LRRDSNPSRRRADICLAVLLAATLAAACERATDSVRTASPQQAAPAIPEQAQGAARGALGTDGKAVAYGDFAAAVGQQVVAVQRLPGAAPSTGNGAVSAASQTSETIVDVIRVSILVHEGQKWKEAFRADEHLKNRRGYLAGAPVEPVTGWRMRCEKTADSGFRLEFTPLNPAPGTKLVTVRVAWNPKRKEYDSLDATGKRFLEPQATPGNAHVKIDL
jgi:hypothetical protein